jgi:hypothetical protein
VEARVLANMPRVDAAMAASLVERGGWLVRRSVSSEVSSVKESFSSWDNCMAASYCKYVGPF